MKLPFLVLCAFLFSFSSSAQIEAAIDHLMLDHFPEKFNGNIYYSRNDSVVYNKSFGLVNYTTKAPLNDSTLFGLASNSKQFTALAIVQLIENGQLNYHTKIGTIIDSFPYETITVEHLLRHQSGLPEYAPLLGKKSMWNKAVIATNKDVISILCKHKPKLKFEPGAKFEYNNTGYILLASLVEEVSGLSFPAYLKKHIFDPLHMNNTQVIRRKYEPVNFTNNTEGYYKSKGQFKIMNDSKKFMCGTINGTYGDAGISSTVLDLEKWKQALRNNTLISQKSKELMFSNDAISAEYGIGFFTGNNSFGTYVYHGGGYITWTSYKPDTNDYIVILCNNDYTESINILLGIYKIIKASD